MCFIITRTTRHSIKARRRRVNRYDLRMLHHDDEAPRWLSQAELDDWLRIVGLMFRLPAALDGQLLRDNGLSFVEYSALARLSEREDRSVRLSELAMLTNASLSRLSHLISRLQARGLVRRETDPRDGRYTKAVLTDEGRALLEASAPGHVSWVRSMVLDAVSPEEFHQFGRTAAKLVERLGEWG
jgi:DNA-binding MarR family transcriptional regulator